MARIPAQEIERLKKEISLVHLVESYGVKLEKKGKDLVGLCPFHNDTSPSLIITPDKNLWHCMGACQTGGSVIDWVMKTERASFTHAVNLLKSKWPLNSDSGSKMAVSTPAVQPLFDTDTDNQHLLNQTIKFYHKTLNESPAALKYLHHRKLNHPEMLAHFKLGFANRTLCYRLPGGKKREGAAIKKRLKDIGILRESGHEHFNGSLVIPIIDQDRQVMGVYGRKINDDLRAGTAYHLYLPGAHKGVFNISALVDSKEIILCEALIDALTFWCYGFKNVTSSYGTNGFTPHHLAAFKTYGIRKVWIAYDHDDAGNQAAETLALTLAKEGIQCLRVVFPHNMDANQYAQHLESPDTIKKAFHHLVKNARPFGPAPEGYDKNLTPQKPHQTPLKHPQNTPETPRKHPGQIPFIDNEDVPFQGSDQKNSQNSHIGHPTKTDPSYRTLPIATQLAFQSAFLAAKIEEFEQQGRLYPAASDATTLHLAAVSPDLGATAKKSHKGNGRGK